LLIVLVGHSPTAAAAAAVALAAALLIVGHSPTAAAVISGGGVGVGDGVSVSGGVAHRRAFTYCCGGD